MGEQRRKQQVREAIGPPVPDLNEGLSKCLDGGHKPFASFKVVEETGVGLLHACSQCGLMFWGK
jgi:hypothetical protein